MGRAIENTRVPPDPLADDVDAPPDAPGADSRPPVLLRAVAALGLFGGGVGGSELVAGALRLEGRLRCTVCAITDLKEVGEGKSNLCLV